MKFKNLTDVGSVTGGLLVSDNIIINRNDEVAQIGANDIMLLVKQQGLDTNNISLIIDELASLNITTTELYLKQLIYDNITCDATVTADNINPASDGAYYHMNNFKINMKFYFGKNEINEVDEETQFEPSNYYDLTLIVSFCNFIIGGGTSTFLEYLATNNLTNSTTLDPEQDIDPYGMYMSFLPNFEAEGMIGYTLSQFISDFIIFESVVDDAVIDMYDDYIFDLGEGNEDLAILFLEYIVANVTTSDYDNMMIVTPSTPKIYQNILAINSLEYIKIINKSDNDKTTILDLSLFDKECYAELGNIVFWNYLDIEIQYKFKGESAFRCKYIYSVGLPTYSPIFTIGLVNTDSYHLKKQNFSQSFYGLANITETQQIYMAIVKFAVEVQKLDVALVCYTRGDDHNIYDGETIIVKAVRTDIPLYLDDTTIDTNAVIFKVSMPGIGNIKEIYSVYDENCRKLVHSGTPVVSDKKGVF